MPDSLRPPLHVEALKECFMVVDQNGTRLAYVYFRDNTGAIGTGISERMTREQAEKVAHAVAKCLPEALRGD
jgi:hypothetical protein